MQILSSSVKCFVWSKKSAFQKHFWCIWNMATLCFTVSLKHHMLIAKHIWKQQAFSQELVNAPLICSEISTCPGLSIRGRLCSSSIQSLSLSCHVWQTVVYQQIISIKNVIVLEEWISLSLVKIVWVYR